MDSSTGTAAKDAPSCSADHVILVSGRVISSGPPEVVCNRQNLEVAFGLGGLQAWEGFLDDPAHHPYG